MALSVREEYFDQAHSQSWHCQTKGGLTRAKIFLVELTFNIHSVQITNPNGAKPNQKLAHKL